MTVTKTPLCTVKGCPAPKDPDWHRPWCEHGTAGEHQHVPKRSQGGKRIVAFLCHDCHTKIDSGPWGNGVFITIEDGKQIETYRAWDLHNKTIIERVLEPDSAAPDAVDVKDKPVHSSGLASGAAPSGSGSPAVEQQQNSELRIVMEADNSTAEPPVPVESGAAEANDTPAQALLPPSAVPPSTGAYDTWAEQIIRVAKKGHRWHFEVGDLANEGEERFGEESSQTLDELGFQPETLSNIMRVCKAIPLRIRNPKLKYSHHVHVYKLAEKNPEEAQYWLRQAEGLTISAFKDALREGGILPPKKPKEKRWTLTELRQLLAEGWPDRNSVGHANADIWVGGFLDWLDVQDG